MNIMTLCNTLVYVFFFFIKHVVRHSTIYIYICMYTHIVELFNCDYDTFVVTTIIMLNKIAFTLCITHKQDSDSIAFADCY